MPLTAAVFQSSKIISFSCGENRSISALPKEYLAESIIKAHTVVAAPGYTVKEGKAGMGNYNHFMTIQEMIDLVAFLKHGINGKVNKSLL